ncbi:MAG: hypothetical protein RLZZ118_151 [Bacteroidota bacterium]|jgi:hypothetical protein|nr:hypothetical protein [Chitinophagaceae bacterium]
MKKIMLALFGLLMLNNAANAQFRGGGGGDDEDGVISQGSHFFSLGYGIPSFVRKSVNTLATNYPTSENFRAGGFGVLHIKYEYAFVNKWTIGLSSNIDYTNIKHTANNIDYTSSKTAIALNVRVNRYLVHSERVGIYSGIGVGYSSIATGGNDNYFELQKIVNQILPIAFEATAGAKIFVTENIGLFAEVGYAKDIFQFGATFRLPGNN